MVGRLLQSERGQELMGKLVGNSFSHGGKINCSFE